jgi:nicotinate phosphoribosyltransferase
MAASYHAHAMNWPASFELFVRSLPEHRNFLISAGLEQALDFLESFSFDEDAIHQLRSLGLFEEKFLSFLKGLRFTGEVWAVPEGEAVFAGEPLLRVTAPLVEAQLLEPFLLNCISFQTMVASKAARIALACDGKSFVDFSLRRDHGTDAALKAARAAFIGGAEATSNVLAGGLYGIPLSGTMAHSYVLAFKDEAEAFRTFAKDFPGRTVFLIDTFDLEQGARRTVEVARELAKEGIRVRGVRVDAGDLEQGTRQVRQILDQAGLSEVQIFLSGDLDEYRIAHLLASNAPADAFGVGTQLGTSGDAPSLGSVYKLVEDEHGPKMKLSVGKATLPGRKQVYRFSADGLCQLDVLGLEGETLRGGQPLLHQVMSHGRRLTEREPLESIRSRCRSAVSLLPELLRRLDDSEIPYPVHISHRLAELARKLRASAP